ncbi:uncharacterized protein C8A04DRAFT_13823 [Dichotomopilus funicola]|uniref:Zn(2)-C6 fungal-type domain-containing protein n=1 Tax=Dichotomopilus funicola TaxID=1934379 RepID=A0AAN6UZJ0_9PEZI|nr:hypothetical protein C8A04DRAFT_13823 [Dichotomopilus funicola]
MAELQHGGENSEAHLCPICLKTFGRKDLRDRHRRRCEKSIGKAKQVKKKACERCIGSKVKCDYEKPACGRCLSRSVACEYKLEPQIRMPAGHVPGLRLSTAIPAQQALPNAHGADDEIQALLSTSGPDTADVFSITTRHQTGVSNQGMGQDTGPAYLWLPHTNLTEQHHSAEDAASNFRMQAPNSDIGSMDTSPTMDLGLMADDRWMPELLDPALFPSDHSHNTIPSPNPDPITRQREKPPGSICSNGGGGSPASSVGTSGTMATNKRRRTSSPTRDAASDCGSLTSPLLVHCQPRLIVHGRGSADDTNGAGVGGGSSLSELIQAARGQTTWQRQRQRGMIALEEAVRMTAEYPLRMLSTTFRSPFIHPRLCRQSPRGMPEPIAVALACVGMKLHSEESGLRFVCDIFRDQRDKLIKELPTLSDNHEQVCASLHAMCIYQIEGLLSENRYNSKLATAVLHHEYLVRATRRLIKRLQTTTTFLSTPLSTSNSNPDWDTWAIQESLRRSIFLLVIIHHLLGITRTLDPAYFEPLLPPGVAESIVLPCEEALWVAETREEWMEARRNYLEDAEGNSGTNRRDAEGDEDMGMGTEERGSVLEGLPELTRLIVSVVSVEVDRE